MIIIVSEARFWPLASFVQRIMHRNGWTDQGRGPQADTSKHANRRFACASEPMGPPCLTDSPGKSKGVFWDNSGNWSECMLQLDHAIQCTHHMLCILTRSLLLTEFSRENTTPESQAATPRHGPLLLLLLLLLLMILLLLLLLIIIY